jgi:hypothetical protein
VLLSGIIPSLLGRAGEKGGGMLNCPKCGAVRMHRDKPVYFNRQNNEGGFLYLEEAYHCRICGKVIFVHPDIKLSPKKFVHGQVCNGDWESL